MVIARSGKTAIRVMRHELARGCQVALATMGKQLPAAGSWFGSVCVTAPSQPRERARLHH